MNGKITKNLFDQTHRLYQKPSDEMIENSPTPPAARPQTSTPSKPQDGMAQNLPSLPQNLSTQSPAGGTPINPYTGTQPRAPQVVTAEEFKKRVDFMMQSFATTIQSKTGVPFKGSLTVNIVFNPDGTIKSSIISAPKNFSMDLLAELGESLNIRLSRYAVSPEAMDLLLAPEENMFYKKFIYG